MSEGPFKSAFEADTDGVMRREILTYRIKNGMLYKEAATREYYKSGDYHDSQSAVAIIER